MDVNAFRERLQGSCFFCGEVIEGKKTREHIISDALLGKLGIKESVLTGVGSFQYSRIKVPAHSSCNSEFGSMYENHILEMLDDPDQLFDALRNEEGSLLEEYSADANPSSFRIATWLSKVYYGLYYNDFLKVDGEMSEAYADIVASKNFSIVQQSYKDGVGFCLPSSFFVFRSKSDSYFDLQTTMYPYRSIMLKIHGLTFILCIEDGFLTSRYLDAKSLADFREWLEAKERRNSGFPLHLYAFGEVLALRTCIKKAAAFVFSETDRRVINLSALTLVGNPEKYYRIDRKELAETRTGIIEILLSRRTKPD
jgi:hypothetical protein